VTELGDFQEVMELKLTSWHAWELKSGSRRTHTPTTCTISTPLVYML
jgi:hypothetical protein